MGTRNKPRKARKEETQAIGSVPPPAVAIKPDVPNPDSSAAPQNPIPNIMRKGIYLSALIYVEGDQAPADNFNVLAKAALEARLSGKRDPVYDELKITLKQTEARTDIEEDADEDGGEQSESPVDGKASTKKPKEEKFEF